MTLDEKRTFFEINSATLRKPRFVSKNYPERSLLFLRVLLILSDLREFCSFFGSERSIESVSTKGRG